MANYQVIDKATGRKINVIVWDGVSDLGGLYSGCRIEPDDGTPFEGEGAHEPRTISRKQLFYALAEWPTGVMLTAFEGWKAQQKPQTQIYFDTEDRIPETNPKIERMCAALSINRADLFGLASSQ